MSVSNIERKDTFVGIFFNGFNSFFSLMVLGLEAER